MLTLLSLLQTRRDWPGRVLADRLEISDRTLRRDVDQLRGLGYRITAVKGPDGGYRLDAGSELPPLLFDDDQAVALAIALQVAAVNGVADGEAAMLALSTVRQVMPSRLRHRIDGLTFTTLPPSGTAAVDAGVLVDLSNAVRAAEVLRFDYAAPGSEPARRRAEPHHLVFSEGRWFLIAWDLEREDWRTFRVDRITPHLPSGPRFVRRMVPGGDAHRYLAGRFKGSDQGPVWPCTGTAVIGAPAGVLTPFIQEGTVEEVTSDSCRVTQGAWSWAALAAAFARFDAPISDVAPDELADAFGVLAQRAAVATGRSGPASSRDGAAASASMSGGEGTKSERSPR